MILGYKFREIVTLLFLMAVILILCPLVAASDWISGKFRGVK